jgi:integrase
MGKLTALKVERARKPGMYSDGDGLYLQVRGPTSRSWIFRYQENRKQRYLGLGSAKDIGLADARELAAEVRLQRRKEGKDPIEERRRQRTAVHIEAARSMTFDDCAAAYIKAHEAAWRNPKHKQQWKNTLATYVTPVFGSVPVGDVDTTMVIKVLQPIWTAKPETAGRVRGRIEAILDFAKASKFRDGENPARWRGHLQFALPNRAKIRAVRHHPALPYGEMPDFWRSLVKDTSDAARLLRFIILTACRYNEAATMDRVEVSGNLWTIPAHRMKAERPHQVPLSAAALACLPLQRVSDVALANCIKRHTITPVTTHGFRSTFRDWAGDCTDFPRELVEQALAHIVENETERAYRRGTALAKRRLLLEAWGAFCGGERAVTGQVVALCAS